MTPGARPEGTEQTDRRGAGSRRRQAGEEKLGKGVNQSKRPSELPTQGLPG